MDQNHRGVYKSIHYVIDLYAIPWKSVLESSDCVQSATCLRHHITFYTQFKDSPADNLAFAYNFAPFETIYTQILESAPQNPIFAYKIEYIITFYTQLKDSIFPSAYRIEDLYAESLIFRHDKKASAAAPF